MSGIIAENSGRHTGLVKASSGGGTWTLIKTLTASSSATLSFVDGADDVVLDSTYNEYIFRYYDIHPETDMTHFSFQGNASGASGYNETITSNFFNALHKEDDSAASVQYRTGEDKAQATTFQSLNSECGNDNDQSCAGYLHLFNPSDTTFLTHFIGVCSIAQGEDRQYHNFVGGYFNVTSAIDEIQFKFSSGDIDAGSISLFGIT